jgi:hypothetical protein
VTLTSTRCPAFPGYHGTSRVTFGDREGAIASTPPLDFARRKLGHALPSLICGIRTAMGEIPRGLRRSCCVHKSRELRPINGSFARSTLGVRGVFAPLLVSRWIPSQSRHEDVSHSESFAKSFRNSPAIRVDSHDSRAEFGCGEAALSNPWSDYFGAREATILDTNFTKPHELMARSRILKLAKN